MVGRRGSKPWGMAGVVGVASKAQGEGRGEVQSLGGGGGGIVWGRGRGFKALGGFNSGMGGGSS